MASFVQSFFPLDVLDEIWDLIESVSEGFLTYSLRCIYDNMAVQVLTYFIFSVLVCFIYLFFFLSVFLVSS